MEPNHSLAPQVDALGAPRAGLLLKNVFTLYRDQFPRWFGITAPTSLLAAAVLWIADQRIKAIFRSFPPRESLHHLGDLAGAGVLRFGSVFVSWLLGCFALAAIATVVNNLDTDDGQAVWQHDSHERAREHFGALVLTALVTFCAFLGGIA